MHVAAVAGSAGMHLFLNGTEVATHPFTEGFKYCPNVPGRLGQNGPVGDDTRPFDGEMAEVRVWKVARR
jgi:hypothetical protein